jgi:hypothetical protein
MVVYKKRRKVFKVLQKKALVRILLAVFMVSLFLGNVNVYASTDDGTLKKVVQSVEEFKASNFPLIASIPKNDIYLYGIKPKGVVLYINGVGYYYDWVYMTPRFIFPKMKIGDYDKDGKNELAVVLYVGSGTGCAVEELHMIEFEEDEFISTDPKDKDYLVPNPKYFEDAMFDSKQYISYLEDKVKLKSYYDSKGELWMDVSMNEKTYPVSLKDLQSEDQDITVKDEASYGDIVHFNMEDMGVIGQFGQGIIVNSYPIPQYIGEIYGDVNYDGKGFQLDNLRYEP